MRGGGGPISELFDCFFYFEDLTTSGVAPAPTATAVAAVALIAAAVAVLSANVAAAATLVSRRFIRASINSVFCL